MKRTPKLALRRETLRGLVALDLARAVGAVLEASQGAKCTEAAALLAATQPADVCAG